MTTVSSASLPPLRIPTSENMRRCIALASLALLTVITFWPGLSGGFLFDDFPALVNNLRLHAQGLSADEIWKAAFSFEPGGLGRPLVMATFAVNFALGGADPWGFKVVGVIVHMVNALLVYGLTSQLLRINGIGNAKQRAVGAFCIAAIWALHPLQVSTVLYVVQRMETLSLTFVLFALVTYVRGRELQQRGQRGWPWIALCIPLLALGLASKETAALLPAYTLALEFTVLGFGAASATTSKRWRLAYAAATAAAALLFVAVVLPHYYSAETYSGRNFNTLERSLSQLRILPMYLGQILWPTPGMMSFYYDDLAVSRGLLAPPTTLAGGILLLALLTSALLLRRRMPLFSLGCLWFFAAHLITSNVIPLELAFEHRNYFALLGVLIAVADLVRRVPLATPATGTILAFIMVAAFGILGMIRAAVWGDSFLLASDLVARNPDSPRAAHDLGVIYYEMSEGQKDSPFFSFAQQQFERESRLPGANILADQSLILMLAAAHLPVPEERWNSLHDKLRHGPISPETTQAMFSLLDNRYKGVSIDDRRLSQAFQLLFERIALPPHSYAQVADHAALYLKDERLAESFYFQAVEASEGYPGYVTYMVETLNKSHQTRLAEAVRRKAGELNLK